MRDSLGSAMSPGLLHTRLIRRVLIAVAIYGVLWVATALLGANQVREATVLKLERADTGNGAKWHFAARATAPVPLFVFLDYEGAIGQHVAFRASEIHLWLLGPHFRVRTTRMRIS